MAAPHLAFYGDDLAYRFTKILPHGEVQWQQVDEIIEQALTHLEQIPEEMRDFEKAKALFMGIWEYKGDFLR